MRATALAILVLLSLAVPATTADHEPLPDECSGALEQCFELNWPSRSIPGFPWGGERIYKFYVYTECVDNQPDCHGHDVLYGECNDLPGLQRMPVWYHDEYWPPDCRIFT